jgi:hypothetical protein
VLLSSLRPSWPLVLLNVSLGDRADLEQRDCGCPLEGVGWRRHLHTVRSFEKLKIGGHTMLSSNIVEILESRLPKQFGGGPTDYQLVEDEAPVDGTPRLRLLVHPEVGAVDEGALAEAFLNHLRAAGVQIDYVWRNIRWIGVERRAPLLSRGGKTLPIYSESWERSRSSNLAAPGQSRG